MFSEYKKRYNDVLPLEETPDDRTLGAIFQLWKGRNCEPVPFPTVLSIRDAEVSIKKAGYAPMANAGLYVQNMQVGKTVAGRRRRSGSAALWSCCLTVASYLDVWMREAQNGSTLAWR